MSTNIVLSEKDTLIAHYFPNERVPKSCNAFGYTLDFPKYDASIVELEKYCQNVWKWEAYFWNRSRFIFNRCCLKIK